MPNLINNLEENVADFTLIIPSVSVGNVPQLTIDLLITTYNFKRAATIWHPAIVPSVGGDPYRSNLGEICTACELYVNEKLKLATIQLRSTLEYKLALQFFNSLRDTISSLKFKCITILTSGFDYELQNITSQKFFYITNQNVENIMLSNDVKQLQQGLNGKYQINGCGFATHLYEILKFCLPCTVLIKYVSEGDNRPDAFMMLQKLFNVLELPDSRTNFVLPSSWEFVYGGPPPVGIY